MIWRPKNERETIEVGKKIGATLVGGDVVLLVGELGAGKTTLAKGIASALGVKKTITSPTFTLMNLYQLKNPQRGIHQLAHIDTYRMKNENDLVAIGVRDFLAAPDTLTIIEWPEKLKKILKNIPAKKISIVHLSNGRRISFTEKH